MMSKRPVRARRQQPPHGSGDAPDSIATLPAWKAFVVQFTHDTGTTTVTFAGRVEHLNSGSRLRFASERELVAALRRLLQQADNPRK